MFSGLKFARGPTPHARVTAGREPGAALPGALLALCSAPAPLLRPPAVPLTWRAGRQGAGHGSRGPDRRRHVERCGGSYCRRRPRDMARLGPARGSLPRSEDGRRRARWWRGAADGRRGSLSVVCAGSSSSLPSLTTRPQTVGLYGVPAGLPGGSTHLLIHG